MCHVFGHLHSRGRLTFGIFIDPVIPMVAWPNDAQQGRQSRPLPALVGLSLLFCGLALPLRPLPDLSNRLIRPPVVITSAIATDPPAADPTTCRRRNPHSSRRPATKRVDGCPPVTAGRRPVFTATACPAVHPQRLLSRATPTAAGPRAYQLSAHRPAPAAARHTRHRAFAFRRRAISGSLSSHLLANDAQQGRQSRPLPALVGLSLLPCGFALPFRPLPDFSNRLIRPPVVVAPAIVTHLPAADPTICLGETGSPAAVRPRCMPTCARP